MSTPRARGVRFEQGSLRAARAAAEDLLKEENDLKHQGRRLRETLSSRIGACASLFEVMDHDSSGTVSRQEFLEAVEALGVSAQPQVVSDLFDEFDADHSGEISYGEYVHWAIRDKLRQSSSRVMDMFRSIDTDGNGVVDKFEFQRAIHRLGLFDVSNTLLNEVFSEMDADHSGVLSFDELHKCIRSGIGFGKGLAVHEGEVTTRAKNRHELRGTLEEQFLLNVRSPRALIGLPKGPSSERYREGGPPRGSPPPVSAGSSPSASVMGSPRPSLPALSPRSPRGAYSPEGVIIDILAMRAAPGGGRFSASLHTKEFAVDDYVYGRRKRNVQADKTEVARENSVLAVGPPESQFFRTRLGATGFASPRWEQPLPAIDAYSGAPIWVPATRGRVPPERGQFM